MKQFTIIGGVNGVGKSSLTGVLKAQTDGLGMIIDVDKLTAQLGGSSLEGGKKAVRLMDDCMEKGVSFTQETTLSGYRTAAAARRAKELGYVIRLHYVGLNTVEECLARIQNRVNHGGHDIPAADVLRRFQGRFEAVGRVLPYCDSADFYDNYNGFQKVAEYRNGEMILLGETPPAWVRELSAFLEKERMGNDDGKA